MGESTNASMKRCIVASTQHMRTHKHTHTHTSLAHENTHTHPGEGTVAGLPKAVGYKVKKTNRHVVDLGDLNIDIFLKVQDNKYS